MTPGRLSFWTLGTPGWSNEAVVDAAKRFGFQSIDIRCNSGGNISLQSSDQDVDTLTQLFAAYGVEIVSLLAYNQRGSEDGVDWPAVTSDLIANAKMAWRLGTQTVRINAGCPARGGDWDAHLKDCAGAIAEALSAAPEVTLLVQNHPGSLTALQAGQLTELVNDQRFGVGLSPDHCVDMGEDTLAVTREIAPWVRQVHLADRVRLPDGTLKACLPGDGFVPNREVLGELAARGFDGWVSFKWEKPTYPDLPDAEVALPYMIGFMSAGVD